MRWTPSASSISRGARRAHRRRLRGAGLSSVERLYGGHDLAADRTAPAVGRQDPGPAEGDPVTRSIQLADVGLPPLDVPEELPRIAAAELEERIAAVLAAVDADHVVVYGD